MHNKLHSALATPRSEPFDRLQIITVAALAVCFASVFPPRSATAAEWSLGPEAKLSGRYEDNARLSEDGDEDEIWGGALDLALVGERRTDRTSLSFRPRLYFDRYDDSDEDSDDQYLDVFFKSKGQRSRFDFRGNLSNEQVRRGEDSSVGFEESELDETDDSTSGRINRRRDRLRWRVRPEYTFSLNQRTRIGAGGQYIDVDYNNEAPGEALDYTDATGELFFERDLSEKNRLRVTAFGSKYEADRISNDSTSYGGGLRFERDVTETFTWHAAAGAQSTDIEAGDSDQLDETQTSYIFSTGMRREWELTRFQAEVSRSVDPSGSGFLKTRDGIRLNLRRQLRPRWSTFVGVYAFKDDDVDDMVEANRRDHVRGDVRLTWQASRTWFIEGGYQYTYQDYDETPGDADSNEFSLGVIYRPNRKTWSR
jgi:hypothetical protein